MRLNRKKVDESPLDEEILKASLPVSESLGMPADSQIEKARRDLMIARLEALKHTKSPVSPAPDSPEPPEISVSEPTSPEANHSEDQMAEGSMPSEEPGLPGLQSRQIPHNRQNPPAQHNPQIPRIPTLKSDLQALLEEIVRCDMERYRFER